jgi:hypothetical protein
MNNKKNYQPDYKTLYMMGIIFTGAGIAIGFFPMTMLGLAFMAICLANREKWSLKDK